MLFVIVLSPLFPLESYIQRLMRFESCSRCNLLLPFVICRIFNPFTLLLVTSKSRLTFKSCHIPINIQITCSITHLFKLNPKIRIISIIDGQWRVAERYEFFKIRLCINIVYVIQRIYSFNRPLA